MNFSLMNSGRPFTDYKPSSMTNQHTKNKNSILTNNEYRKYLTENASSIMSENSYNSYELSPFTHEKHSYADNPTKKNYVFTNINDNHKPYEHEPSDLKDWLINREQLEQRKHTPLVDQDKLLSQDK